MNADNKPQIITLSEKLLLRQIEVTGGMGFNPYGDEGKRIADLERRGYVTRRDSQSYATAIALITEDGRKAIAAYIEHERAENQRIKADYARLTARTQDTEPAKTVKAGRGKRARPANA